MENSIRIKGARVHNLKNINVEIPRDKFVVVTGISGSGKSSLAFDTIYAEGQRRYIESLSSYARQFLGQMDKPDLDTIDGLSPAISIDQKSTNRNPRSTVGTVTEIYDYYRLLYARCAEVFCPECGEKIQKRTIDSVANEILELEEKTKLIIYSPIARLKKGSHKESLNSLEKDGFTRVRVNGELRELQEDIKLAKTKKHNIELLVDRIVLKEGIRKRLVDSLEIAFRYGGDLAIIHNLDKDEEILYNMNFSCSVHGACIREMEPRMFSFNAPFGACEECKGLGFKKHLDLELLIEDESLSLDSGAFSKAIGAPGTYYYSIFEAIILRAGFTEKTPYKDYSDELKNELFHGTGNNKVSFKYKSRFGSNRTRTTSFDGIIKVFEKRYHSSSSEMVKEWIENFMAESPCEKCLGARLKKEVLSVKIDDKNIFELCELSIDKQIEFLKSVKFKNEKKKIAEQILREIFTRLEFLTTVGLSYLNLSRSASSLSGGEAQRIRLATQIGSALCGVLYVLDEPSIGLHQRDNAKLIKALKALTSIGNSLIVVEHDEETMRSSDYIIDIGPEAGENGGKLVAKGTIDEIIKSKNSITGKYLSGELKIDFPSKRREQVDKFIEIFGARENNLKNIDVKIPLGVFTAVTGVSGSGKSTLVEEILHKALRMKVYKSKHRAGEFDEIKGYEYIDKIISVDQSPIGKTPRSNPATYTKVFDHIRDLFAMSKEAKARSYKKGRFSFNVKGGRCEACKGDGLIKIEMHFLSDIYVPCESCSSKRYNKETLEVKYKGKNISDVLDMTVKEAYSFFENIPKIKKILEALIDVGLSYIKLGQPSTQLSGGEAQRIKLSSELCKRYSDKTFYILDEPTTGLHSHDVKKLIDVLQRLASKGATVLVIEHNLDLIKNADYIIDIGPEGGDAGGEIIAFGTPEEICKKFSKKSHTAKYLKPYLK